MSRGDCPGVRPQCRGTGRAETIAARVQERPAPAIEDVRTIMAEDAGMQTLKDFLCAQFPEPAAPGIRTWIEASMEASIQASMEASMEEWMEA